jgi:putative tricarboxylic transport membrane protein
MEAVSGLLHGFAVALTPANILWCFVGCFLGTVVGILPGLGPAATIAMLLPLTYNMDPAGGIIMLSGIGLAAAFYLVFIFGLDVALPTGFLGF